MNIYQMIGNAVGTSDAMELAERLAHWHDRMVAHERRGGSCADDCPHTEAAPLWDEAVRRFGERAGELRFLRSCGRGSIRAAASPVEVRL
jgi:hypothetical protein